VPTSEASELPSAEPPLPAGVEDAPAAAPFQTDDLSDEFLDTAAMWRRSCDDYFTGEQWAVDLRDVALTAASMALILGGHYAGRGAQRRRVATKNPAR
jgi:hypothetical protein